MFSHLPIILIHLRKLLDECPHFIDYGLRKQNLHIRAEACYPRIERLADLHAHRNREMIFAIWNEHGILTEPL